MIAGQFKIVGAAPDGDSVRFYPTQSDAFTRVGLGGVRVNSSGGAQLRLDGIDALETHYSPPHGKGGPLRQPAEYGDAAAARLLEVLGFSQVRRKKDQIVISAKPAGTPGYVLTRFTDTYGRCVSFAFAGEAPGKDLTDFNLTAEHVVTSVNGVLLAEGLAYPTYYSKLFPDLRQAFTTAVQAARKAGRGLWPRDRTTAGFTVAGEQTLTEEVVILPKLFRRLTEYLAEGDKENASLDGFSAFVASQDDRLLIVSDGHFTGFDTVVAVDGQKVSLRYPPEDLVFTEK